MAKQKPGFMLYHEDMAALHSLNDAQLGALIRAMTAYSETGEARPLEDGVLDMAFSMLRHKLDHDRERYEAICGKRSEAGRLAHAGKRRQTPPNAANINVNPNVNPNSNINSNGNLNSNSSGSSMASPDPRIVALEELKERIRRNEP